MRYPGDGGHGVGVSAGHWPPVRQIDQTVGQLHQLGSELQVVIPPAARERRRAPQGADVGGGHGGDGVGIETRQHGSRHGLLRFVKAGEEAPQRNGERLRGERPVVQVVEHLLGRLTQEARHLTQAIRQTDRCFGLATASLPVPLRRAGIVDRRHGVGQIPEAVYRVERCAVERRQASDQPGVTDRSGHRGRMGVGDHRRQGRVLAQGASVVRLRDPDRGDPHGGTVAGRFLPGQPPRSPLGEFGNGDRMVSRRPRWR